MSKALPIVASPAAAYRADMHGRSEPFGADDDAWLAAASALKLAASASPESRRIHLDESIGIATALLGEERIAAIADREWKSRRGYVDAPIALADLLQKGGALNLAGVMLDDLAAAAPDLSAVERGRILTLRARVDWKLGRLDEAMERYEWILALGAQSGIAELTARAELGFTAIAQLRGNYPAMLTHAKRAAEIAEADDYGAVARMAHNGVMISSAMTQRYDDALLSAARVLELSRGDHTLEAEGLLNLGQLMLEFGHSAEARACFGAVMQRVAPTRLLLPALGGLALASARLGNESTVEWSVAEVWRARQATVPRYELAAALVECASALGLLGRDADRFRFAKSAAQIVDAEGFHELSFRLAELDKPRAAPPVPVVFKPKAADVARELQTLEPERLPTHVEFETAPV